MLKQGHDEKHRKRRVPHKKFLAALLALVFVSLFFIWKNDGVDFTLENNFYVLYWSNISAADRKSEDRFLGIYNSQVYVGQKFSNEALAYLPKLGLDFHPPLANFCTGQEAAILKSQPVFVSAMSDNHFHEGLIMLKHLSNLYAKKPVIILYDIGLSKGNQATINGQYGKSILITMKAFPFEDFPKNVRNLVEYRWKPLIIAMELREHPSLLWMDTSILHLGLLDCIYDQFNNCSQQFANSSENSISISPHDFTPYCPHLPWLLFDYTGHSIFAATNPRMLNYLPMPKIFSKTLVMIGANVQLIYGLHGMMRRVMRFWALCALEPDCMAPKNSHLHCSFAKNAMTKYGGCHRFDQSALNILLAWHSGFSLSTYFEDAGNLLKVVRG